LTSGKCAQRSLYMTNKLSFDDDIITQSRLMAVSEFYFGPISMYYVAEALEEKIREKNIRLFLGEKDCLLPGFVLFVNFAWINIFYQHIYPLIQVPFVLITGGIGDDVSTWRNDSKIIHHYGVNCIGEYDPKFFTCLPLGISDISVWGPSALPIMLNFSDNLVFREPFALGNRQNDILIAFSLNSHPYRTIVRRQFCGEEKEVHLHRTFLKFSSPDNLTNITCVDQADIETTYHLTLSSRFVPSPQGHGMDCFRTWEALYLGAFPIVVASSIDSLYTNLPVVIVQSWSEVTESFLRNAFANMTANRTLFCYDKLRLSYWERSFNSHGFERHNYSYGNYTTFNQATLDRLGLKDGDLIKGDTKLCYAIFNHSKHAIPNLQVFMNHGWDFRNVRRISDLDMADIMDGPDVS